MIDLLHVLHGGTFNEIAAVGKKERRYRHWQKRKCWEEYRARFTSHILSLSTNERPPKFIVSLECWSGAGPNLERVRTAKTWQGSLRRESLKKASKSETNNVPDCPLKEEPWTEETRRIRQDNKNADAAVACSLLHSSFLVRSVLFIALVYKGPLLFSPLLPCGLHSLFSFVSSCFVIHSSFSVLSRKRQKRKLTQSRLR